MVNCIVAACAQIGDLSRTFETFDALQTLGLSPDTNSYNAALLCCMCSDSLASAPKVHQPVAACLQACHELGAYIPCLHCRRRARTMHPQAECCRAHAC